MLLQNCTNCGQAVANDSKFCKHCGTSLVQQYQICEHCQHKNTANAIVCARCSTPLEPDESAQKAYLGHFMRALRQRILEDHRANNLDAYLNAFYESDFHKTFLSAANQLSIEANEIRTSLIHEADKKADILEEKRIQNLLDFFIIHHTKTINAVALPEQILKYQTITLADIRLLDLTLDYLGLDSEGFPYFTDFLKMPVELLKNASTSFLFPKKDEKIWVIVDLSGLDNCKEGFAITEEGIYWKAPFETPQSVYFRDLKTISREQEWLLINDIFFNANPSLNLKMLYLLRKLKVLF